MHAPDAKECELQKILNIGQLKNTVQECSTNKDDHKHCWPTGKVKKAKPTGLSSISLKKAHKLLNT